MFADVGGIPTVITKGDDNSQAGMFGASGMWIFALVIIFFALAFFGGTGFGNRRDGATTGLAEIAALNAAGGLGGNASAAAFTEINGRMDALSQQISHINDVNDLRDLKSTQALINQNISQQACNLATQIATNRTDTLLNFKDLALQTANCCCETQRGLDTVKFQQTQDTCAIINNSNTNAQRILDRLATDEITRLRDDLAKERLASSQLKQDLFIERQSDRVIGALRPAAVPAYPSWPSAQPISPLAYGAVV